MAFVLKKLNKLPVKVKGILPDEEGKPIKFDFTLHCKRKTQDEIDDIMKDKKSAVKEFVREVVEGWDDVLEEDGIAASFSRERLDEQLNHPGLPLLIMHSYLEQVSATAKN